MAVLLYLCTKNSWIITFDCNCTHISLKDSSSNGLGRLSPFLHSSSILSKPWCTCSQAKSENVKKKHACTVKTMWKEIHWKQHEDQKQRLLLDIKSKVWNQPCEVKYFVKRTINDLFIKFILQIKYLDSWNDPQNHWSQWYIFYLGTIKANAFWLQGLIFIRAFWLSRRNWNLVYLYQFCHYKIFTCA